MRRYLILVLSVAVLLAGGCSQPVVQQLTPIPQPVAQCSCPQSPQAPATAKEYLPFANTDGALKTPKPGSRLRTKLMNAAREHFGTKSKFYAHDLSVDGEVAKGTIEPYPRSSGQVRDVTWVRWKQKWSIVEDSAGVAPTTYSEGSGSASPAGSSSYLYGDANGDGDSGVLYPSVPSGANPSDSWTGQNTEWHWVNGYSRSDGTYVSGHYRRTE